jgi:hypothetical protein
MRIIRRVALAGLAALLSSCWSSETGLIPASAADMPDIADNYAHVDENDEYISDARVEQRSNGDFILWAPDDDGTLTPNALRLDWLFDGWYLAQSMAAYSDGSAYGSADYRLIFIEDDGFIEDWSAGCDSSDTSWAGVTENDGDCSFTSYDGLRGAASARAQRYDRGDKTAVTYMGGYEPK